LSLDFIQNNKLTFDKINQYRYKMYVETVDISHKDELWRSRG